MKTKLQQKNPKEVIEFYLHCKKCAIELPKGVSPRDFQRIQLGWTKPGLQVWCVRHDVEIVHLDFLGQKVAYINGGIAENHSCESCGEHT